MLLGPVQKYAGWLDCADIAAMVLSRSVSTIKETGVFTGIASAVIADADHSAMTCMNFSHNNPFWAVPADRHMDQVTHIARSATTASALVARVIREVAVPMLHALLSWLSVCMVPLCVCACVCACVCVCTGAAGVCNSRRAPPSRRKRVVSQARGRHHHPVRRRSVPVQAHGHPRTGERRGHVPVPHPPRHRHRH